MAAMETIAEPLTEYLSFLALVRQQSPVVIRKNERFIKQIELGLGKPLFDAKTGSEIEKAVFAAAKKRKKIWNGGHIDDGTGMRFRLGQAAACYLRWAHQEALIDQNPYTKNTFRRANKREAGFLTDEQIDYLYRCDMLEFRDIVLVRFFMDTGLRVSEVCSVKIADIDFEERTVKVYLQKTDEYHRAPLSIVTKDFLITWLAARRQKSEYLFCNRSGERIHEVNIRERFRDVSRKVSFRVHPHMLRHTAISRVVENFGQIAGMQFGRHKDPGMTNHYTHLHGKKLVKMVDQMAQK
jgi:site-specific recombinase XerC